MQTIEQLRSGALVGIRRLKLCCGLTRFPTEIYDLADTLEILDLSGNQLSELPEDLHRLKKLRIIFCSDNRFTELPDVLGRCAELSMVGFKANQIRLVPPASLPEKLRWLILTDNEIEELPSELGACLQLQKLMLAGNKLRVLPESLVNCQRLELVRIAANQLETFPDWLLSLPRLSWLAYSGNPFSYHWEQRAQATSHIDEIRWDALTVEQLLGEGASGVIYRALHTQASAKVKPVAVKLFKGAMTSDGLPQCEMTASIHAGKHPSLINVIGKIIGHPADAEGLVMELISPDFHNLAGPPSLDSCTRDIYPEALMFDLSAVLSMANSIASVGGHLHRLGITHGDLYGHNILYSNTGGALMGDFGAASFYPTDDQLIAERIERLEIRAFGCLLEELAERCHVVSSEQQKIIGCLDDLTLSCLNENILLRPDFDEITRFLQGLMREFEVITAPQAFA